MYNYHYKNDQGEFAPYVLHISNIQVINPTEEQYASQGYYPYVEPEPSEEEIRRKLIIEEIDNLKAQLSDTDYIALKAFEGYDCDTLYPGWKAERARLRGRINELEEELNQ